MNYADFFTQPLGFPLESDATLGFMQTDYQNAVKGLAKAFGADMVIVSGMAESGGTVADGWVLLGGDLVFFEGGAKQSTFVVSEVWQSKNNSNGSPVNRYKTKKAVFGTGGTTYLYANLVRVESISGLQGRLFNLCIENEVILSGCAVSSVNTGASTLVIAAGVAMIGSKFVTAPSYSGAYPVFLKQDGTYSTTAPVSNYIRFDPYTSQRLPQVIERASFQTGDIKITSVLSDRFDATGLGKWERKGWAICNGQNGTMDMRGRMAMGYAATDAGDGQHDAAYATLGNTGGSKSHVLSISEMPSHNHTENTPSGGPVTAGQRGLIRRTTIGQSMTVGSIDSMNSGTEPDVTNAPEDVPYQGGGSAHENRPAFRVLAFIQRV